MHKQHNYYVYILTNSNHSVLYTGVTNDMARRIFEHKNDPLENSFCYQYNVHKLIYYEYYSDIETAIQREKFIKGKSRKYKEELIYSINPYWMELNL